MDVISIFLSQILMLILVLFIKKMMNINHSSIDWRRRVGFEETKGRVGWIRIDGRPAAGFGFTLLLRNSRKSTILLKLIGLASKGGRVGACENIGTAGKWTCKMCIWTCEIRTIKLRRIACTFRKYS